MESRHIENQTNMRLGLIEATCAASLVCRTTPSVPASNASSITFASAAEVATGNSSDVVPCSDKQFVFRVPWNPDAHGVQN